jgi:protein involved in polysaccharide export with SLBB domain
MCMILLTLALSRPAVAMVHAGDELQVTVYNHPELSRKVTVDASEDLSLPLAGTIEVHGLELAQIATRIVSALDAYVRKPAVDVELAAQGTDIFVSGGPGGVLKYQPGETLAGGMAELADATSSPNVDPSKRSGLAGLEHSRIDLHRVAVERDGAVLGTYDAVALSAAGDGGPTLIPGDTIVFVNKPDAIRVLGDVAHPGTTYVGPDETLADAVEQVGGVNATAASAELTLRRGNTTTLIAMGALQMHQPAQSGDVLTIPTAPRVSVVGQVEKPGSVLLTTDFSLVNALYQAGGPSKWGNLGAVSVNHNGTTTSYNVAALIHGNTAQNPTLSDGDTVFVPEGHKIDYAGIFSTLSPLLYLFRPF